MFNRHCEKVALVGKVKITMRLLSWWWEPSQYCVERSIHEGLGIALNEDDCKSKLLCYYYT